MSNPCTLCDLLDRLGQMEETYLLELLGLDSRMLVERFADVIEENFDKFESELEEEEDE